MGGPVIRLDHVTKRYLPDADAAAALDDVSITVGAGELVAVTGRSGSGKTTFLNLAGGLDRDYAGTVEVLGKDLRNLSDRHLSRLRNESIGFVFQSYHLLAQLSVGENVGLPAMFAREAVADLPRRIGEVLEKVGLASRRGDAPTRLSGGQKQRVAIARALLMKPALLLCDEPTGNLDQKTGRELIAAVAALTRTEGLTVVIVTHEEHVAASCDRVVRLADGKVEAEDAP
jgi:ABC-type lipoprotein export system ATPase subunit